MFLLDTNVVSELRKIRGRSAAANVAAWANQADSAEFYISAITLLEIETGIQRLARRDPVQGSNLRAWITGLHLEFLQRILPVDAAVAFRCATLHVPISAPLKDSLIAATALVHDMTVVTRNVKDFAPTGVRVLNPWEPHSL